MKKNNVNTYLFYLQPVPYRQRSQLAKKTSETVITDLLQKRFPRAKNILVEDTSGGCGQMFSVLVESEEFKNLSILKQHKMVYDTLGGEIKIIHGLHLTTRVPDK